MNGVPVNDVAAIDAAEGALGDVARRGVPLGPLTTYRVGGAAALFVEAESIDALRAVARARHVSGLPVLVVGRGSNLLVADRGFPGIAVSLGQWCTTIEIDGTHVRAGSAVSLPVLARRSAAAGLTGLEWAVGVPGSVGGGVRMNAGGHGGDIAQTLVGVRVFDLVSGEDKEVTAASLQLAFRRSALGDTDIVLDATFGLAPGDPVESEAVIDEIVRWRRENQPGGQNAGSVFVNPLPDSAGRIIDSLGLRGLRVGTAFVSDKHANFIQADEGGSSDDVHALMVEMRRRVRDATGLALRSEIRLIGFEEEP